MVVSLLFLWYFLSGIKCHKSMRNISPSPHCYWDALCPLRSPCTHRMSFSSANAMEKERESDLLMN